MFVLQEGAQWQRANGDDHILFRRPDNSYRAILQEVVNSVTQSATNHDRDQ
jgi:hypothetical protein